MAYADFAPSGSAGQPLFHGRFGATHLGILANRELSALDKTIYGILASHRNAKSCKAYPRRSTVAKLAGVHVDSVSRSTARLESLGFIVRVHKGGAGNPTHYLFPLLDQRAATAPGKSGPAKVYSDPAVGLKAADTIERDFCEAKTHPKPLPSVPEVEALEVVACGEFFGPQLPALESDHGLAPVSETDETVQQETPSPAGVKNALQDAQAPEPTQPHGLAFPEALALNLCAQIARMLAGIPQMDAQALVDEMAWNSRSIVIQKPPGYMRKLLKDYRAGTFTAEVAHFEKQHRERQNDIQRSRRMAEQQHLEALARGKLPAPPPPSPVPRTEAQTATGLEALAAMRAALGMKSRTH